MYKAEHRIAMPRWSDSVNYSQCFYNDLMIGYIDRIMDGWLAVRSINARDLEKKRLATKEEAKQFVEDILEYGTPSR